MQQTAAENLQTGTHPGSVGAGRTRRYYLYTGSNKNVKIRMPSGVAYFGLVGVSTASRVEIRSPIAGAITALTLSVPDARKLAADTALPCGPIEPDEIVIIRHEDDATNVGVLQIELEGFQLPTAAQFAASISGAA